MAFAPGFAWKVIPRSWKVDRTTAREPATITPASPLPAVRQRSPKSTTSSPDVVVAVGKTNSIDHIQPDTSAIENETERTVENESAVELIPIRVYPETFVGFFRVTLLFGN
jgi:hypothetical protein